MQDDPSDRKVHLVPAEVVSRRTIVSLTAKLLGGAALSVLAGAHWRKLPRPRMTRSS